MWIRGVSRLKFFYSCIGCVSILSVLVIYFLANSSRTIRSSSSTDDASSDPLLSSATSGQRSAWPQPTALHRQSQDAECEAKSNIFFLKTHKCASSSVQNVLMRYGRKHRLTFVLPTLGNYLGNQAPFHHGMAAVAPWHDLGYNIFCHHTVFQAEEVASIMPADTVYVSIVREPVSLFESLYSYAHLELHFRQSLEEFAASRAGVAQRHLADATDRTNIDRSNGYLGVNQMAYDFGIRPHNFSNLTFIREQVRQLDQRFGLVMVAEYFDESMILLKELLCWTLEDVAYFAHNVRRADTKKRHLSAATTRQLESLNQVDAFIYQHFKRKFLAKVKEYGYRKMVDDVAKLRSLNKKLFAYCAVNDTGDLEAAHVASGGDNSSGVSSPDAGVDKIMLPAVRGQFPPFVNGKAKTFFSTFSDDVVHLSVHKNRRSNHTCADLTVNEITFTARLKMAQMMRAIRILKPPLSSIRFVPASNFSENDTLVP